MEQANSAAFQLQRFSIPNFFLEEADPKFNIINVNFNLLGIYNTSNGEYKLSMEFKAIASTESSQKEYKEVIRANTESYFIIESKPTFENIPDFFYPNSIAIVYPYIRAFVSNITLQAGLRLMILPILNLSALAETLKKNTTVLS